MSGETRLWAELDAALLSLADACGTVGFWLRDDDAVAPSAALDRLIDLAGEGGVPLSLAVIPAHAEAGLARRLNALPEVSVLQHGFAHVNHAAPPLKKCELGTDRPVDAVLEQLAEGRELLRIFDRVSPVLVPPWNRIAGPVAARLPEIGFRALSLYGGRERPLDAAGLLRFNTHVDPVDWRGSRGFVGREPALVMLLGRLRRLLEASEDRSEPTGILTHHLVHDEATFAFLADLVRAIGKHAFCRWHSAETLLGLVSLSTGDDAP